MILFHPDEAIMLHPSPAVPPTLLQYPSRRRSVSVGEEFIATCTASAEPPANIIWFKEDEVLPNGVGNISELIQGNMTTSRLVIESFTSANSSLYSCMARNSLGNDTASVFISTRGESSCNDL